MVPPSRERNDACSGQWDRYRRARWSSQHFANLSCPRYEGEFEKRVQCSVFGVPAERIACRKMWEYWYAVDTALRQRPGRCRPTRSLRVPVFVPGARRETPSRCLRTSKSLLRSKVSRQLSVFWSKRTWKMRGTSRRGTLMMVWSGLKTSRSRQRPTRSLRFVVLRGRSTRIWPILIWDPRCGPSCRWTLRPGAGRPRRRCRRGTGEQVYGGRSLSSFWWGCRRGGKRSYATS